MVVARILVRGDTFGGWPRGRSGGGARGRWRIFEIFKTFLTKIAKNALFYHIFQNS